MVATIILTAILSVQVVGIWVYWWFVKNHGFFQEQGIPGPRPHFFFGSWWNMWTKKLHEVEQERYIKYGRVFGVFDGRTPNLFVSEPALLRQILVKDFEHFMNRRQFKLNHKYLNSGLSSLVNQEWKNTRCVITPAFSTAKIRQMTYLMSECAQGLNSCLTQLANSEGKINTKQIVGGLTMEIIGSCAFGVKIDSTNDRENPFVKNALKLLNPLIMRNELAKAVFTLNLVYPELSKVLAHMTPACVFKTMDFFSEACINILEQRRLSHEKKKRYDFLDNLLEAAENDTLECKTNNPLKNETVLIAQILLFLLAGFDTTATTMALALHSLAMNQQVQQRLREEIKSHLEKHDFIDYDMISEMQYLEQVVAETLRLYPPVIKLERKCEKDIQYGKIKIQRGQFISVPVFAIHRDPENYKDPLKFDPERFSPENKAQRDRMIYLPWGIGPRNCPAIRFALVEVKVALCYILKDFHVFPVAETVDPPVFNPGVIPVIQFQNLMLGISKLDRGK